MWTGGIFILTVTPVLLIPRLGMPWASSASYVLFFAVWQPIQYDHAARPRAAPRSSGWSSSSRRLRLSPSTCARYCFGDDQASELPSKILRWRPSMSKEIEHCQGHVDDSRRRRRWLRIRDQNTCRNLIVIRPVVAGPLLHVGLDQTRQSAAQCRLPRRSTHPSRTRPEAPPPRRRMEA